MKWVLFCLILGVVFLAALFAYSRWELSSIEEKYPPAGERVQLDGLALHYVEAGDGPVVVLLHGASANLRDFTASLIEPLARSCRVLAFDRPGHGYSIHPDQLWMNPKEQAAAIHAGLGQLGIERAVWLGHSWAGSIVMAGLLQYPQAVTGGVLLGGAAYPWEGGVDWTNHLPDYPLAGPLFMHTLLIPLGKLFIDGGVENAFAPNQPAPNYRRRAAIDLALRPKQFTTSGREVRLLSDFLEVQSKRYESIEQPLLMIHGEADDVVPAWNHADRLIKLLPQAKLSKLPATGHLPHHVHTEEVAKQIARFACNGES